MLCTLIDMSSLKPYKPSTGTLTNTLDYAISACEFADLYCMSPWGLQMIIVIVIN